MVKKIIVIGASSGIGKAIAEAELKNGSEVVLVARREKELKAIASKWNKKGQTKPAILVVADVTQFASAEKTVAKAIGELGGLDEVYYASGVMPAVASDEYNIAKDLQMLNVNTLGAVAYINPIATYFAKQGKGKIVGISSIAGERGRKGAPVYNTSKAALNTYLEALRNRLAEKNVQVTTIKPGFVKTEMTEGLDLPEKGLLKAITSEEAAEQILKIVAKGKDEAFVPGIWKLVALIIVNIPNFIFKKLSI
ncbi:SDR family NAD(P)-dependent oxidoreductase [Leptospira ilyithenensis]|uniref:SDR family NAD(P)-dependent oxidoreductase n=1 Tax=Leptospira ilyithenensis TaxID=2484901 RepID=A0A4R9LLJ0_9LEPT|nr:SDR family NAD(P)-dependent oxidoreductase [Leptospira ilyithenensis]TGN06850.1 SDR family NAD(P)-dependent oxidoreductase [Leptospira ilyithenensis]